MSKKLEKATRELTLHPRDRRSSRYATWKRNIASGMRAAKLKRREAGLRTLTEVAVELCLPVSAIRTMNFSIIEAGGRRYIRQSEVERWKKETGADAA
jgi:hypothetical protein